jgi:hypothetical protein
MVAEFDYVRNELLKYSHIDNIMLPLTLDDLLKTGTMAIDLTATRSTAYTEKIDFLVRDITALRTAAATTSSQAASTSAALPTPDTINLSLPATSTFLNPADQYKTSRMKRAEHIIRRNREAMRYLDGRKVPDELTRKFVIPLFTGGVDEEGHAEFSVGNPVHPDEAMKRVNQRPVFEGQADRMAYSLEACSEFEPPQRIFVLYPKVVYDRMLAEDFDEAKMLDGLSQAELAFPDDPVKAVLQDKTHVLRLIAGNHTVVGQAKLVKQAQENNRFVVSISRHALNKNTF